jgi:hypothetical protein
MSLTSSPAQLRRCDTDSPVNSVPAPGWPRVVDEAVLRAALAALDAVINCEPFADVSPPGTEGFLVYEEVAAAREHLAAALGEPLNAPDPTSHNVV